MLIGKSASGGLNLSQIDVMIRFHFTCVGVRLSTVVASLPLPLLEGRDCQNAKGTHPI